MIKTLQIPKRMRSWALLFMLALPLCLAARTAHGDVNNDGEVNLADVNEVINSILSSTLNQNADINGDGEITVADANEVINIILNGGEDPLLEACKSAVEVDQVVSNLCGESNSLEELMSHSNDIEALDDVEYVFSNDNTTLYVVIKEFGTISYSYYPSDIQSNNMDLQHQISEQMRKMINSNSEQSHDHTIDQNEARALFLFQMSKNESWSSDFPLLVSFFEKAGIDTKVETSINIETFRYDLFNYDYITILTHGGYEFDNKKYEKDATYRGTHWLSTTEELPSNLFDRETFLYFLRKQYDSQDVSFGHIEETRNGKKVMVPYLKVSDHFIESSESSFKHRGNAIVFNTACHSMQGPGIGIYEGDTINYNLARAFASKGAGLYIGYDQETTHADEGAVQFYSNLISGMSVQGACENLQNSILHDFKYNKTGTESWWADFVSYFPSSTFENTCIFKPLIEVEDNSDEKELFVKLSSTLPAGSLDFFYEYVFNEKTGTMAEYSNYDVMDLSNIIKYGFELSETEQFANAVRFGDKGVHLDESTNMERIIVTQNLKYNPSQSESQIKPNTTYWARAYIYDGHGYNYSEPVSFTTIDADIPVVPSDGIDLGLPSGTKWAPYNVGATKPEEYGGYYAWGETETKEGYYWSNYVHCDGTKETCHDIGEDITGTEYDVAHVKWGGEWKLPTSGQLKELMNCCTKNPASRNGVKGYELIGPNGNRIFFPSAGYATGNQILCPEEYCIYNSGSVCPSDLRQSMCLIMDESTFSVCGIWNSLGHSVRPVINAHYDEPETEVISVGNTGLSIKMIGVQGGTFTMGATPDQGDVVENWEKPAHLVTLSSYRIAQTEVTQALWKAVMGSNPSTFTGDLNRPVETVNWDDCQLFITKLNQMTGRKFRLPTEAEWEFAARGGNKTNHYMYSGSNIVDEVAWYPDNSDDSTHPVAQKKPNELGIYDMSGNVWEFCQDWYSYYSSEQQYNPTGAVDGSINPYRIIRGGSWLYPVEACRVAYRNISNPSTTYRNYSQGFRLAMDAD